MPENPPICFEHGPMKLMPPVVPGRSSKIYYCPICDEEGIRAYEQAGESKKENDKRERIKRRFRDCQIGKRFLGLRFSSYHPVNDQAAEVMKRCQDYANNFEDNFEVGAGLVMLGNPGTGKNHLAAAICTEVISKDFTALHTTVMKMVRRIKSTWRQDAEENEQKAILSFCEPDLLVIDEAGVQFGSVTEKLLLTEIINERYERILPTIMISNLKVNQLTEVLGERIIDRFRDGGEVLSFNWESYRRRSG